MRLAVFQRSHVSFSLQIYRDCVLRELEARGVSWEFFSPGDSCPAGADLMWEPSIAGSLRPHGSLRKVPVPVVATVHGAYPFAFPWHQRWIGLHGTMMVELRKLLSLRAWHWFRGRVAAVIVVSDYAGTEIAKAFGLPSSLLHTIYHGVDSEIFHPGSPTVENAPPVLLHACGYHPKKNTDRILQAYQSLRNTMDCPPLVVHVPNYPDKSAGDGVTIIRKPYSHEEFAGYCRDALAFVFPSMHETFGLPLVEAMACGCPVITSDKTACPEIVGDAALTVDPLSTEDIAGAMRRVIRDRSLRQTLRARSIERAAHFTWERCGREHLDVFENAITSS